MSGSTFPRWSALLLLCSHLLALSSGPAQAQTRVEGEYGLWVTDDGVELGVHWLTSGAQEGFLQVLTDDGLILDTKTPRAESHEVSLPRLDRDVLLRYGVAGSSRLHSTRLFIGEVRSPESGIRTGVDSLFVVGDVHGEYERLLRLLMNARLTDAEGTWTGGRRHVVFLGDLFDRGADVTKTLWLLYRLEQEARSAGGGSHVVLGNHEALIFTHDVRYVAPKEQLIARMHGASYPELFDVRSSLLGKWLAERPGVMRVDGALLAHGGILPGVAPSSVEAVNDSIRTFIAEDLFYRWADSTVAIALDMETADSVRSQYSEVIVVEPAALDRRGRLLFEDESILWFRGYVQTDTLVSALEQTLNVYGAELHVVAHTPVNSIENRYDGRIVAVGLLEPATEMLLLVRDLRGSGYERWRFVLEGPPEAL